MKRAFWLVCVLVLSTVAAGTLPAQSNPFIGTWKLNLSKSKFDGIPAPKSLTRTVVADGAGANYTFSGEDADGKPIEYSFTSHFDGKDCAVTGSGMPGGADTVAMTRVNSNMIRTVLKKGGTAIGVSNTEVSRDGKVSIVKVGGVYPDGKKFNMVSVYDEQ
jgi:hypothetical protein